MSVAICPCSNTKIVWSHIARDGELLAGGTRVLRKQCQDCGALSSNSLQKHHAKSDTPEVDVAAVASWNRKQKEYFALRQMSFIKQREDIKDDVVSKYEAYLQTEEWRAKRLKVLKRANWSCEGCGEQPATQVHHLSYLHLGSELLWELKAVCPACHARCHPEKSQRSVA